MWYVNGTPVLSGKLYWQYGKGGAGDKQEGVKVSFHLPTLHFQTSHFTQHQRRQVIKATKRILEKNNVPWIAPGQKEWTLDLDKLKEFIPGLRSMDWFKGKAFIDPEFEPEEQVVFDKPQYNAIVAFYIVPEALRRPVIPLEPPVEIQESLRHFEEDYSDSNKVAFVMMQFRKTEAHDEITEAIISTLDSHGIIGVRADDKQYHDDLFFNVMTYLYGCGFGIAVFERIEAQEFSPNVSLEVGYMLGLRKDVCLLKDKTLKTLPTDLIGKLYKAFNPQDPIKTIPNKITQWLSDKEII